MSLGTIVRQKLIDDGVSDANWPVYIGYDPDRQDQAILINLTPGIGLAQEEQQGETVRQGFHIRVRSAATGFAAGEAKWRAVFNSLQDADLSSSGIRFIQALNGGPNHFIDENNRNNFTVDFQVKRDTP